MEWNLVTIGLLLVVLIIGYLIGLLEASLKGPKERKAACRAIKRRTLSLAGWRDRGFARLAHQRREIRSGDGRPKD
jgi:hypothetical protein